MHSTLLSTRRRVTKEHRGMLDILAGAEKAIWNVATNG